jgi:thiol-disulfide isomerase/thioredoxin
LKKQNLIPFSIPIMIGFSLLLGISTFAGPSLLRKKYHFILDKDASRMAVGLISSRVLLKYPAFKWFKEGMDKYSPNDSDVNKLKSRLKNNKLSFIVFGGTWCDDTRELLPEFYKTMKLAEVNENRITLYALDRDKACGIAIPKEYNITNVPTFIIIEDGKEIGRIVESVDISLERDLSGILALKIIH